MLKFGHIQNILLYWARYAVILLFEPVFEFVQWCALNNDLSMEPKTQRKIYKSDNHKSQQQWHAEKRTKPIYCDYGERKIYQIEMLAIQVSTHSMLLIVRVWIQCISILWCSMRNFQAMNQTKKKKQIIK